jgi:hypothetical protein
MDPQHWYYGIKVCSPSGKVVRIVIFRKASLLHAMVEFDSVETASHAKRYDF